MSAEILKEFLVSIGFKADEEGAHKVGEQIRTMTLGAVALGASLESLAVTTFAVTARISKSYSDIYFQSKKVGDSAGNIKAFGYAVEQLGGSAEEAGATLESFYRKIGAGGPGQEKWLEQFIGQTRDAKGALRETSEMVDSFLHSKKFMNSPEYLQRRYIEMAALARMSGGRRKTLTGKSISTTPRSSTSQLGLIRLNLLRLVASLPRN